MPTREHPGTSGEAEADECDEEGEGPDEHRHPSGCSSLLGGGKRVSIHRHMMTYMDEYSGIRDRLGLALRRA